jgi:hypothetical protein
MKNQKKKHRCIYITTQEARLQYEAYYIPTTFALRPYTAANSSSTDEHTA